MMQRLQREIAGYDLGALSPSRPRLTRWKGSVEVPFQCRRPAPHSWGL
ncbi:MAG TPA: hypothetical protein DDZ84_12275 [Firmicutes bacterium]|nr:hypothetical protein [Bacillota bacterium]